MENLQLGIIRISSTDKLLSTISIMKPIKVEELLSVTLVVFIPQQLPLRIDLTCLMSSFVGHGLLQSTIGLHKTWLHKSN